MEKYGWDQKNIAGETLMLTVLGITLAGEI